MRFAKIDRRRRRDCPERRRGRSPAVGMMAVAAMAAILLIGAGSSAAGALGDGHHAGGSPGSGYGNGADGIGIRPGKIKHVWLIILENKS
jgi:hypothetical protein